MKRSILLLLVLLSVTLWACRTEQTPIIRESAVNGSPRPESSSQAENMENIAATEENSPSEIEADGPGVLQAIVGKNSNYIYHMLAVSNCGYTNAYGDTYRSVHLEDDLAVLKNNEQHLTIKGSEYEGSLYFTCVITPAALDDEIPAATYFEAIADLFSTGEIERNFEAYRDVYELSFSSIMEVTLESNRCFYEEYEFLKEELTEIAMVLRDNYTVYMDEVWEDTFAELSAVTAELNQVFEQTGYTDRWQEILGLEYRHDAFYALLCNSMANGPDCIDVSDHKDVFNYVQGDAYTAQRISHEFGIYILKDAVGYKGYAHWGLLEGLAEYYNILVSGGFPNWNAGDEYIDFYTQLRADNPEITPEEMFSQAIDTYLPDSH